MNTTRKDILMSYNITGWKVSAVHLELPRLFDFHAWVAALPEKDEQGYENSGRRWCLQDTRSGVTADLARGTWTLHASGKTLSGVIEGETYVACDPDRLDWTDDGSGHLFRGILLPLFHAFKGDLAALVIWEGGDSIERVTITHGSITREEVS